MTGTDMRRAVKAARAAGASEDFIAVLMTDAPSGGRHHPRMKVRAELDMAEERGTDPKTAVLQGAGVWGHFMTALFEGRRRDAWARADIGNRNLMRAAGCGAETPGTRGAHQ